MEPHARGTGCDAERDRRSVRLEPVPRDELEDLPVVVGEDVERAPKVLDREIRRLRLRDVEVDRHALEEGAFALVAAEVVAPVVARDGEEPWEGIGVRDAVELAPRDGEDVRDEVVGVGARQAAMVRIAADGAVGVPEQGAEARFGIHYLHHVGGGRSVTADRGACMILCSSGVFFVRGADGHWVVPDGPDVGAILDLGPQLGVDGIEILVTRGMLGHLDAVADLLSEMTLPVPAVHAPKRVGAALPDDGAVAALDETARFASRIGADVAVLHLWDLPDGDRNFDARLDAVVLAADVFAPHGVTLAIETIPCLEGTPLRNIERVLEREPRAGVALDTEFLAMHDEIDDALAADWLWPHVKHVHVKDYAGALVDADGNRRYVLPGDGSIDFPQVFGTLDARGYRGAVSLEANAVRPEGGVDVDALRRCFARITHSPWTFT